MLDLFMKMFSEFYLYFLYTISFVLLAFSAGMFWLKNKQPNNKWQFLFLWSLYYAGHEYVEFYNTFLNEPLVFFEVLSKIFHLASLIFFAIFGIQNIKNQTIKHLLNYVLFIFVAYYSVISVFYTTIDSNFIMKIFFALSSLLVSIIFYKKSKEKKTLTQLRTLFFYLFILIILYGLTSLLEINYFYQFIGDEGKVLLILFRVFIGFSIAFTLFISTLYSISFKGYELVSARLKALIITFFLIAVSMVVWGMFYVQLSEKNHTEELDKMYFEDIDVLQSSINTKIKEYRLVGQSISSLISSNVINNFLNSETENQKISSSSEYINKVLDSHKEIYGFDVVYLMDLSGEVFASTNRFESDSFLNQNYSFREYFTDALSKGSGAFISKGVTSGIKGLYVSVPIKMNQKDLGVLVIKNNLYSLSELFESAELNKILFSSEGDIFYSNNPNYIDYKLFGDSGNKKMSLGFIRINNNLIQLKQDAKSNYYIFRNLPIEVAGWKVGILKEYIDADSIYKEMFIKLFLISMLCITFLFFIFNFIYSTFEIKISQLLYKDLFDNTSDIIQSIDMNGNFLYVNHAWKEMLGYSDSELEHMFFYDIVHPDDREHCDMLFKKVASGDKLENVETRLISKGKKVIFVRGNSSCSFKNGKPFSTRGIFRDVTEEKKNQEELKTKNEELENFSKMVIGRELKMIELKKKLKEYQGKTS